MCILSQCMQDMSSDELILRQSAAKSLLSFVLFAASILGNNMEDKEETGGSIIWTKICIVRIIKKTLLWNIGEAIYKDNSAQKVHTSKNLMLLCHGVLLCTLIVNAFHFL